MIGQDQHRIGRGLNTRCIFRMDRNPQQAQQATMIKNRQPRRSPLIDPQKHKLHRHEHKREQSKTDRKVKQAETSAHHTFSFIKSLLFKHHFMTV